MLAKIQFVHLIIPAVCLISLGMVDTNLLGLVKEFRERNTRQKKKEKSLEDTAHEDLSVDIH